MMTSFRTRRVSRTRTICPLIRERSRLSSVISMRVERVRSSANALT